MALQAAMLSLAFSYTTIEGIDIDKPSDGSYLRRELHGKSYKEILAMVEPVSARAKKVGEEREQKFLQEEQERKRQEQQREEEEARLRQEREAEAERLRQEREAEAERSRRSADQFIDAVRLEFPDNENDVLRDKWQEYNKYLAAYRDKEFVFRGMRTGMTVTDAVIIVNLLTQEKGARIDYTLDYTPPALTPEEEQLKAYKSLLGIVANDEGDTNLPYRIWKEGKKRVIKRTRDERPFAITDEDGTTVVYYEISKKLRGRLFGSALGSTEKECLELFAQAYGIPRFERDVIDLPKAAIQTLNWVENVNTGKQYLHRFKSNSGIEITYWENPFLYEDRFQYLISFTPGETITIRRTRSENESASGPMSGF